MTWKALLKNGWTWWAIAILFYGATYLHFRVTDNFVHRAGNYARIPPYYVGTMVTHFIEPGQPDQRDLPDEMWLLNHPEMRPDPFGEEPLTDEQIEMQQRFRDADSALELLEHRTLSQERLFGIYIPLAFVESWVWKLVDPNPLSRRQQ